MGQLAVALLGLKPPISSSEQAKVSAGTAICETSYGKVADSPAAVTYIKEMEADASLADPGARLVHVQKHPALYKFLISPVTLKERPGRVYEVMYECRITLEESAETLVRRVGENRLQHLDRAAHTAILSMDASWFASRQSYMLLGVYAPPNSRVVQADSFFALFPLMSRQTACFRLVAPAQTTAFTGSLFQVRTKPPAYFRGCLRDFLNPDQY